MALPFPQIDPVAVAIGPFAIRWYALAYLAGFLFAWWYCMRLAQRRGGRPTPEDVSDFVTWAILGVILGGRLGSVLFYRPDYYLENPLAVLMVWQGGMSFHGGLLGVIAAMFLYSWKRGFSPVALGDLVACAAPVGLFLGRLANFVNGELYGRVTDVPWAMVFPHSDGQPRHPSQLYQAGLEGIVLFIVLFLLSRRPDVLERTGTLAGTFLVGYGLARITGEFFREPDANLGFLAFGATMGQLLSVPMVLAGLFLILRAPWGRRAAEA